MVRAWPINDESRLPEARQHTGRPVEGTAVRCAGTDTRTLEAQLRTADEEAARLAEALARGGNLRALLDKLQDRERQRAHLRQQLDGLAGLRQVSAFDVKQVEEQLLVKLADC